MISVLSKETIDKIAAGEVVERPLSTVKELVENSIDAGANVITIEIKDGGIGLIRVTDNGYGIKNDECEKAFLRHSTSKITNSDDLNNLSTLGFRGEALSSISAVSKTELITKQKDSMLGKRLIIEGGTIICSEEIAAPNGTTFFVRDLFFNTPVRRKFLKSNSIENASIEEVIEHLSLSRPDISFKLIIENKQRIFTSGSGNLKNTILELYGLSTANSLLEVKDEFDNFKVSGFIGKPVISRGNRNSEHFFVNKRYINSKTLSSACEDGYSGYIMQHRFPFVVLNLDFAVNNIDVNVHPSKMEVRFNDPIGIKERLTKVIKTKLSNYEDIENISLFDEKNDVSKDIDSKTYEPFETNYIKEIKENIQDNYDISTVTKKTDNVLFNNENDEITPNNEVLNEIIPETKKECIENKCTQEEFNFISEQARKNHRIIGQVFGTYWLIEYEKSLYIMDQHAAHEKVLFEKIMKSIENNNVTSQQIVPPIIVSLSPTQEEILNRNIESYEKNGFIVEHFGGRDYQITGIPAFLPNVNPDSLFLETLVTGNNINSKTVTERVASLACKAAVKGNSIMSINEVDALITDLLSLDNPYHCPHGRPTLISFTRQELDKKFKRIV